MQLSDLQFEWSSGQNYSLRISLISSIWQSKPTLITGTVAGRCPFFCEKEVQYVIARYCEFWTNQAITRWVDRSVYTILNKLQDTSPCSSNYQQVHYGLVTILAGIDFPLYKYTSRTTYALTATTRWTIHLPCRDYINPPRSSNSLLSEIKLNRSC